MQKVVDKCLLNYEVFGKGKENVLILHGWGRSLDDWRSVARKISIDRKVILLDLPGFGNSSEFESDADTYDYVKIVVDFIKEMNLKDLILIGHSFGGKISVVVASENGSIKKLVLIDASGVEEKNLLTKIQIFFTKKIKYFRFILPKSVMKKIYGRIYSQAQGKVGSFKKIVIQNVDREAEKIKVPTLIIWGERDKEVTTLQAKKFRSLIKNSTLRIVWGASHHPHLEKQDKFLEILDEFI